MGHPCKAENVENCAKIDEKYVDGLDNLSPIKGKTPFYQCKKCLEIFTFEIGKTEHACADTVAEEIIENDIESNDDAETYDLKKLILTDDNLIKAAQDIRFFTCFSCKLCEHFFFTRKHLELHIENDHPFNEENFDQ